VCELNLDRESALAAYGGLKRVRKNREFRTQSRRGGGVLLSVAQDRNSGFALKGLRQSQGLLDFDNAVTAFRDNFQPSLPGLSLETGFSRRL
jgi:hypothetical protein